MKCKSALTMYLFFTAIKVIALIVESVNRMAKIWAKNFYNSKTWKKTSESVKAEANYICQKCNIRPAEIVHHIIWLTPQNINDIDITLNKKNLIAVCRECHALIHEGKSCTTDGLTFNDRGELIEVKDLHNI